MGGSLNIYRNLLAEGDAILTTGPAVGLAIKSEAALWLPPTPTRPKIGNFTIR